MVSPIFYKGVGQVKEVSTRERLIHLHECRGIGVKTIYKMLSYDPTLKSIYFMSPHDLREQFQIPSQYVSLFFNDLHTKNISEILSDYNKKHITIITIVDKEYPFLLKQIYMPPYVLYCQGDTGLLQKKMIAVVGTRIPTVYGLNATRLIVKELVEKDFIIVSGLAKGVDFEAHKQAIAANGKTIAVLGSGFEHIYPREHITMAEEMKNKHLLLTEYPPYIRPHKSYFPARNRIISGLSLGTLVIEAKEKSGSLITAQFALNEGREVFAVPGSIFSPTSKGTNLLIQEGAKLVMSIEDILTEFEYSSD